MASNETGEVGGRDGGRDTQRCGIFVGFVWDPCGISLGCGDWILGY